MIEVSEWLLHRQRRKVVFQELLQPLVCQSKSKIDYVSAITEPLFNLSLNMCTFSLCWQNNITPVFKSSNWQDIQNYRRISSQSGISKVFDHLVYEQLIRNCQIVKSFKQHGFMHDKSSRHSPFQGI